MRPRMYGSSESHMVRNSTCLGPGCGTANSSRRKSDGFGSPTGREASTMRRAVSGMGGLRLIPPPPGEGGRVAAGWGLRFKRKPYRFKDTFEFTIDLVITEPEYPVSKAAQSFIPEIVPPSVIVKSMLMSIYLGHEPRASALKVNNLRRDRRLT